MHQSPAHATRLVADIGGTNSRLALYDPDSNSLGALRTYHNRDYRQFHEVIAAWLDELAQPAPAYACLAVAAPPTGDIVRMINIDWSFSCRELAAQFGFSALRCINDFEANAHALPHLADSDLLTIHPGSEPASDSAKLATVGPGTGLGGATLSYCAGEPVACASEPGHMGLAAATPRELALFSYLQPAHGEVFTELLLSGPGLQRLYLALAGLEGRDAQELTPEMVSARALAGECALCREALEIFCALLGSACGDYVLANGAYGGLYLAGGIIPGMTRFLSDSDFVRRFQAKGNMREQLSRVPLYAITGKFTGLLGAAQAPLSP